MLIFKIHLILNIINLALFIRFKKTVSVTNQKILNLFIFLSRHKNLFYNSYIKLYILIDVGSFFN